jgi:hypothetical protein
MPPALVSSDTRWRAGLELPAEVRLLAAAGAPMSDRAMGLCPRRPADVSLARGAGAAPNAGMAMLANATMVIAVARDGLISLNPPDNLADVEI